MVCVAQESWVQSPPSLPSLPCHTRMAPVFFFNDTEKSSALIQVKLAWHVLERLQLDLVDAHMIFKTLKDITLFQFECCSCKYKEMMPKGIIISTPKHAVIFYFFFGHLRKKLKR